MVVIVAMTALGAFLAWSQTAAYFQRLLAQRAYWFEPSHEATPLAQRYGPERFSRDLEEWIIRDAFQDKRDGVFLDVGANHYRDESNTYYLESRLGWSGLAVDALAEFAPDYAIHRPRTRFVAMFASDVTGERVKFFVPNNQESKLLASSTSAGISREGFTVGQTEVPTSTLDDLLEQANINHVNFVSMDVELAEPKALKGFNVERYRPDLVCIEAHQETRQAILDYFRRHGYVLVGKYLRIDVKNLYFRPAS